MDTYELYAATDDGWGRGSPGQYWDCDDCGERYPLESGRMFTNGTGNALLCQSCFVNRNAFRCDGASKAGQEITQEEEG